MFLSKRCTVLSLHIYFFFNSPMRLIGKLFHSFAIEIQVDVFDVGNFREELSLSAIIIWTHSINKSLQMIVLIFLQKTVLWLRIQHIHCFSLSFFFCGTRSLHHRLRLRKRFIEWNWFLCGSALVNHPSPVQSPFSIQRFKTVQFLKQLLMNMFDALVAHAS